MLKTHNCLCKRSNDLDSKGSVPVIRAQNKIIFRGIGPYVEHFYYVRNGRRKASFCAHLFPAQHCQPAQPIPLSCKGDNRFIFTPIACSLSLPQENLIPTSDKLYLFPSSSNISSPAHLSLTIPTHKKQSFHSNPTAYRTSTLTGRGKPNYYTHLMETNEQAQPGSNQS